MIPTRKSDRTTLRRSILCSLRLMAACGVLFALSAALPARAQQQAAVANPARITQPVDNTVLTTLKGNVHPLANAKSDRGAVAASLPMNRMIMVLKRSDAQEAALKTFLDQQQDKHSANFHQWLTPAQLGEKYGPNSSDIKSVENWLQSEGFSIGSVAKSGMFIEFSGTAGQVAGAFHTEIHSYLVDGELRHANAGNPQIPSALAPVVAGFASLNNFPRKPASHFVGTFARDKATGKVTQVAGKKPGFTYPTSNGDLYLLGPYDLATIYNIQALWNAGLDGTGQTIAIVGQTDINLADANNFRSIFGLPANPPNIIVNGVDPGFTGDEGEADIDTQWSGAVAKNATIDFVTSASTETTSGIDLSALYIVDNNLAPVMSESYLYCEEFLGNGGNAFYNLIWQQAAAQGITVLLSAGDSGSANCDYGVDGSSGNAGAQYGLAVSGMSSTPYDLAVGGTDFDQIDNNPALYWNSTNTVTTQASAKGYIPETTWNNSCTNKVYEQVTGATDPLTNCNNTTAQNDGGLAVTGGAGGPSSCSQSSGNECVGGYPKPSWQVGTFNDNVRDTPDISLFASNGFAGTFYVVCDQDANNPAGSACSLSEVSTTFQGYGGTSVASPALAGMFSILNQKLGSRVGNANYALYNLAAKEGAAGCNSTSGPGASCIFNDITKGTISQPCVSGSPNCYSGAGDSYGVLVSDDGSGYGTADASGYPGDFGWNTAVGYDYATGLGTINAYNLVEQWTSANFISSSTTLSLSSTSFTHGATTNASVTVTSTTGTPSGDVSFNGSTSNASVGFATLSGGAATVQLNNLPGGSYNVVAHYSGNNDGTNIFGGSDSNPVAVTVTPEASATTVSSVLYDVNTGSYSSGTTAPYGAYYVLPRVDVAGASGNGVPTGTVALTANGSALSGSPFKLNSGGNTEDQNFAANAGTYSFSASYSGDASFNASTGTGTLTITQQTPTGSLSSSAGSVTAGTQVTLNAAFDTTTVVGVAPTGTVTFYAGTTALGAPVAVTASDDSNRYPEATATLSTTAIPVGTNSITAKYNGDTNYTAATSPAVSVSVTATAGTLAISGSAVPAITAGSSGTSTVTVTPGSGFTGAVNLTATISPTTGTSVPTLAFNPASVTISGTTAATSTLTIATTSTTTAGTYTVTLNAADAATGKVTATNTLTVTVNAVATPTLAVAGSAVSPITAGSSGTSTVTVTPGGGFTGSVNLTATISPTTGTSVPTLTFNPTSVSISGPGSETSALTIATTATTTAGSYTVTIDAADAATGKVTATNTLTVTVNASTAPGSFTISGTSPSFTAGATTGNTSTLTLTSTNNYAGTVNLTCALTTPASGANSSYYPACTLSSAAVTLAADGAGTATATFSSTARTTSELVYPKTNRWYTAAGGAALACLVFFGIPARRRSWRSMLGLLVFLVAAAGIGCGGGSSSQTTVGTSAGNYVFTVTGTDSKTSTITTTGTITVTVQ